MNTKMRVKDFVDKLYLMLKMDMNQTEWNQLQKNLDDIYKKYDEDKAITDENWILSKNNIYIEILYSAFRKKIDYEANGKKLKELLGNFIVGMFSHNIIEFPIIDSEEEKQNLINNLTDIYKSIYQFYKKSDLDLTLPKPVDENSSLKKNIFQYQISYASENPLLKIEQQLLNPVQIKDSSDPNYIDKVLLMDVMTAMVKSNGMLLQRIPKAVLGAYAGNNKLNALFNEAVSNNGLALEFVTGKKTIDLCRKAIAMNGMALEFVPDELKKSSSELAVKNNGMALQFVPVELREKFCGLAVENNGMALQFVPVELREKFCELAVKNNGMALEFVPVDFFLPDLSICDQAIGNNPMAIQFFVSKINLNDIMHSKDLDNELKLDLLEKVVKLWQKAVSKDGLALKFFDKIYAEYNEFNDIYKLAVINNPMALEFVPDSQKTKEMCLAAVKNNPMAIEFVPDIYKDNETCLTALRQDFSVKRYIPVGKLPYIIEKIKEAKTIVVYDDENQTDPEILDSCHVYQAKHKVKEDPIIVCKSDLNDFLQQSEIKSNPDGFKLIFVGHANKESQNIAGLDIDQILDLARKYPVNKIVLLGCHSAAMTPVPIATLEPQEIDKLKEAYKKYLSGNLQKEDAKNLLDFLKTTKMEASIFDQLLIDSLLAKLYLKIKNDPIVLERGIKLKGFLKAMFVDLKREEFVGATGLSYKKGIYDDSKTTFFGKGIATLEEKNMIARQIQRIDPKALELIIEKGSKPSIKQ